MQRHLSVPTVFLLQTYLHFAFSLQFHKPNIRNGQKSSKSAQKNNVLDKHDMPDLFETTSPLPSQRVAGTKFTLMPSIGGIDELLLFHSKE